MRVLLARCRSAFVSSMPLPRAATVPTAHRKIVAAHFPFRATYCSQVETPDGGRLRRQQLEQIQRFAREPLSRSTAIAIKIFSEIKDSCGLETWNHMLGGYSKAGNEYKCEELFENMKASGLTPDEASFNLMLFGYVNSAKKQPHGRRQRWKDALALLEERKRAGFKPDVRACTALLDLATLLGDPLDVRKAWGSMSKEGVEPTLASFNVLLGFLTRRNDQRGVKAVLEQIEQRGLQLERRSWNMIISMHAKNDDEVQVMQACQEMQAAGISKDKLTITSLLGLYSARGDVPKTQAVLAEMRELQIKPDHKLYSVLINGFAKRGDIVRCDFIVSEMEYMGLQPDQQIYSRLVHLYSNQGDSERLVECLVDMKDKNMSLTTGQLTEVISVLVNHENLAVLLVCWDELAGRCKPTLALASKVLGCLARAGDAKNVLRVMSDVERLGMTNPPLDASEMKALAALHNAVLEMLLPTPPEFKQYLRRMEETRVPFSRDTHETIICSAARAGEPDVMHERYEALKEAGFTPTARSIVAFLEHAKEHSHTAHSAQLMLWALGQAELHDVDIQNKALRRVCTRLYLERSFGQWRADEVAQHIQRLIPDLQEWEAS